MGGCNQKTQGRLAISGIISPQRPLFVGVVVRRCFSVAHRFQLKAPRDGRSHRLNREEAIDKNHDKKANMVESRYRLQILGEQTDSSAVSNISTTLAAEEAAANI